MSSSCQGCGNGSRLLRDVLQWVQNSEKLLKLVFKNAFGHNIEKANDQLNHHRSGLKSEVLKAQGFCEQNESFDSGGFPWPTSPGI